MRSVSVLPHHVSMTRIYMTNGQQSTTVMERQHISGTPIRGQNSSDLDGRPQNQATGTPMHISLHLDTFSQQSYFHYPASTGHRGTMGEPARGSVARKGCVYPLHIQGPSRVPNYWNCKPAASERGYITMFLNSVVRGQKSARDFPRYARGSHEISYDTPQSSIVSIPIGIQKGAFSTVISGNSPPNHETC